MMATQPAKAIESFCDAKTRKGARCRRPAGWGTPHLGRGRCRNHGGSTPTQITHERRAEAMEFARGALGAEVDIHPLDALLVSVRLAAGVVAYHRAMIRSGNGDETGYARALGDLNRFAKTALDAGVAERQVQIAERTAERLVLAFEDALADVALAPKDRAKAIERYATSLSRLEDAVIDGDDVAYIRPGG